MWSTFIHCCHFEQHNNYWNLVCIVNAEDSYLHYLLQSESCRGQGCCEEEVNYGGWKESSRKEETYGEWKESSMEVNYGGWKESSREEKSYGGWKESSREEESYGGWKESTFQDWPSYRFASFYNTLCFAVWLWEVCLNWTSWWWNEQRMPSFKLSIIPLCCTVSCHIWFGFELFIQTKCLYGKNHLTRSHFELCWSMINLLSESIFH